MNKKHLTRTLLLSAAFITACGEDNSTIPSSSDLPSEVANMNELATCNCNVDIIGRKVYVKDIAQNYECDGDHWFKSYDQPKSSASLLNPESSSNAISSSTTNKPLSSSDKAQSSSSVAPLSSGVASSSSIAPVGCQTCEYGTLTDERDGQTYKTVKIGEQVWMAENLNYNYDLGSAKSFCYEDDSTNCDRYGRLYSWSAVMDSAGLFSTNGMGCGVKKECTPQYPIQGVCPEGWHVPNKEELLTLLEAVGGKQKENGYFWNNAGTALKSTSGWNDFEGNGTDAFGFSALPAGYLLYHLNLDNRMSYSKGDEGYIASSTQEEGFLSQAVFLTLTSSDDFAAISAFSKEYASSVRCLKGAGKLIGTGKLKDERDGQIYRTIKIGNQVWMAQNLNYAYNEPTTTQDSSSFCYGGNPTNCTVFGRLYLWSAAMDSVGKFSTNGKGCGYGSKCSATGKVRGVCPSGWHLPSRDEVITLLKTVGGEQMPEKDWQWENAGKALKSVGGWNNFNLDSGNGTDEFGFSAIPAGNWDYSGKFFNIGDELNIMTTSLKKNNSSDSYYLSLLNNESYASIYSGSSMDGQSVRCIMDEE